MIGAVICSHHDLGRALLDTVSMIVGEFPAATSVSVRPGDGPEAIREHLVAAIAEVDSGEGVVLLCDMLGGTPSNLSLSLLGERVEVVTGVNVPMLLKLFTHRSGEHR